MGNTGTPRFTIATPSFRNSGWLKLCIASVADQEGVTLEHIVQDAESDDGTLDWLQNDTRVQAFVEKDSGMYDAVNRAWRRARGEILAYLNCDEQYLPGALKLVAEFFDRHTDVDILCGDAVVIGPDGEYRFHRKILPPTLYHTWVCHLASLTCATFVRRSFIERHNLYFDPKLRDVGDCEWMVRALHHGAGVASVGRFLAAFGDTGVNMSSKPNAIRERRELTKSAPALIRTLQPLWTLLHRLRRAASGIYSQNPFEYSVYTLTDTKNRQIFRAACPTFRWQLQNSSSGSGSAKLIR
jgi:glycosyltransferase involved in cell wall biosynthesis